MTMAEAAPPPSQTGYGGRDKKRIRSIDILRGIVMVIMALDHTRDFYSNYPFDPTQLEHHPSAILFFTRWITHFCAPVFVFLSGTSVWLSGKGKAKTDISKKLLTRGLWLLVLEVTVIHTGWAFDFNFGMFFLQVIWALGWSMIFLSAVVFLPRQLVLAIGLLLVAGHNAFDGFQPPAQWAVLWDFLHVQGPVAYGHGGTIMIIYPLIPWIGVMAVGYCFGAVFDQEEQQRNRSLYIIGLGCIGLFVVLRGINVYGDPSPWVVQDAGWRTVLSFINVSKYPPSLLYLLMTLGVAITLLPMLERTGKRVGGIFTVYGRVPMFYYILHLYLIHSVVLVADYFFKGTTAVTVFAHPGYSLPVVYLFWLAAVVILYFPSKWFMGVKGRYGYWWLSYL